MQRREGGGGGHVGTTARATTSSNPRPRCSCQPVLCHLLARLVRRWRSFAASGRSERAPSSGPPFSHPSKKKNKFHASHVVTSALAWAARSAGQAITHPPCDDLAWSDVLLLSSKHIVAFQSRRPLFLFLAAHKTNIRKSYLDRMKPLAGTLNTS